MNGCCDDDNNDAVSSFLSGLDGVDTIINIAISTIMPTPIFLFIDQPSFLPEESEVGLLLLLLIELSIGAISSMMCRVSPNP